MDLALRRVEKGGDSIMSAGLVDQCVRLGMAIVIIALISVTLYRFSGRANAIEPNIGAIRIPN